ncbi:ankyrin [Hypoxylon sp. FL1284]|nr:ankyrin [Hypoxylon sp. FL1284]
MGFAHIPNEVIRLILISAVRVRGCKRAVRLRLVSRAWNVAVEDAIFASGILDEDDQISSLYQNLDYVDFAFWQRYLVYRALHNTKPCTVQLSTIREVAERIVEVRGNDPGDDTQGALRECVSELCHAVLLFRGWHRSLEACLASEAQHIVPLHEDPDLSQHAFMTAAAYMNDTDLARQLLSSDTNCQPQCSNVQQVLGVLVGPYPIAAYKGNLDFIALLDTNKPESPSQDKQLRALLVCNALAGNQMSVLDHVLGPSFSSASPDLMQWRRPLLEGLSRTTSVDVFKRCFEIVQNVLQYPSGPYNGIYRQEWLINHFGRAAKRGAVPLMEYLVGLGAPVDGAFPDDDSEFARPISLAALSGQEAAVKWLLDQGARLDRSLQAAVARGSRRVVHMLLDHGAATDRDAVRKALVEAVKRENPDLFRLLVRRGAVLDGRTMNEALRCAKKEQLESMVGFLKESFRTTASEAGAATDIHRVAADSK